MCVLKQCVILRKDITSIIEWSKKPLKPSHNIYSKQPKKEANKLRIERYQCKFVIKHSRNEFRFSVE